MLASFKVIVTLETSLSNIVITGIAILVIFAGKTSGFFFGAGASIECGIPSMREMTRTFTEKLKKKGEKKVFNIIYSSLEKIYGKDNVDLEAIMSVISALKEKERLIDNIGELGLFILEKNGILNHIDQFKYDISILDNLESRFNAPR